MKSYNYESRTFIGKGGIEIFSQSWSVSKPEGILVISHGLGEHSGRYKNIIEKLEGQKISLYMLDHRGHGKSGGKRGHVNSFMEYIYDLKLYINLIKEDHEELPLILLGHSMGGLIALKYALTYPEDITGLILSSSLLMLSIEVPGWKTALGNALSKYIPGMSIPTGLNPMDLSHDEDAVDAYENDPLVFGKVSARWYTETTAARIECLNRLQELKMPLLIFHGKEDKLVDYRGSIEIEKKAKSDIKELHIFEGLYHEPMNESEAEREKVLNIVNDWIKKIIKPKKKSGAKKKNTPQSKSKKSPAKKSKVMKKK